MALYSEVAWRQQQARSPGTIALLPEVVQKRYPPQTLETGMVVSLLEFTGIFRSYAIKWQRLPVLKCWGISF
jgi:hypothetical protein